MKIYKYFTYIFILFLLLSFPAYAQEAEEPEKVKPTPQETTRKPGDIFLGNRGCISLIEIYDNGKFRSFGSGVIIKFNIKKKPVHFLVTAAHVVKKMEDSPESMKASIAIRDKEWNQIEGWITSESILYTDKKYDFSIVKIPENMVISGEDDEKKVLNIQFLKKINTGSVPTGTDCVMVGHRLMIIRGRKRRYIYITKSGIVAGKYFVDGNDLPPYYIIDSMANKGMSGGVVFVKETGSGIGIISGYYHEPRQKIIRKAENKEEITEYYFYPSSDLTVVVPMGIVWESLLKLIKDDPDKILNMD
ncbi:MAG: serine protease [Candidatus Eremiobacteraeota bacterium]|nr:serine protease [Candidatus Eremiobacteraeota bacterium]